MPRINAAEALLTDPISAQLKDEIKLIAAQAPALAQGVAAAAEVENPAEPLVDPRLKYLLATHPITGVRIIVDAGHFGVAGPPLRGTVTRWMNKAQGKLAIVYDGTSAGRQQAVTDQGDGTSFLLKDGCGFRIICAPDGSELNIHAATSPAAVGPFLLAKADLQDPAVLEARARAMVAPALSYHKTIATKRSNMFARMGAAQMFSPLHIAAIGGCTPRMINDLSIFRFNTHPKVKPALRAMHSELPTYNALVKSIPPLAQRKKKKKNGEEYDSFDIAVWWRQQHLKVPNFALVLRAVLTQSPNSCAPERVFSILNNSFKSDQHAAHGDYMQLSLQLQFNERTRTK